MKVIEQSFEVLDELNGDAILKKIELCGRVCYKSEDKITDDSAKKFVANIIKRGHESVLEHFSFSVRLITDRSVTHELVRHRLASYSQESQRYVKYGDVAFIRPVGVAKNSFEYDKWEESCRYAGYKYSVMLEEGIVPQFARSILPNSTKTEIIVTANLREWRHILKLRTSKSAHPQIRELMIWLLNHLRSKVPVVFDDIGE